MIIKYFIYIISLFFMFLANGCFRNKDAAHSARLEIKIKEYENLLKQEQSKKQSLESEINSLRKNNNYNQKSQEIHRLESELRNSKNNESILTSQINNLQTQLNTARGNDSSQKVQELSNELSNLKNKEFGLNYTINNLQTVKREKEARELELATLTNEKNKKITNLEAQSN